MSAPIIAQATLSDIPEIYRLVESVYRGEHSLRGWTTEAKLLDGPRTSPELLTLTLNTPGSVFLTARVDGRLMASVHLQKHADHAHLGMLSVDVEAQNQKLGRRMLEASEEFIKREWSLNEIHISVIDTRLELIPWYERRGFKKSGRKLDFPDDPRIGTPRAGKIQFDEMIKKFN